MKLTDITKELSKLFDAMDERGGIVVWHDPDAEFTELAEELDLPGVEVMREEKDKMFLLKRALNADLTGRRILLYRPRPRRLEGDWLADVEVRSQQFSADYASILLRELDAPDTREMRDALRRHKALLAKKRSLAKIRALRPSHETPQQLELSIMALALDAAEATPVAVTQRFLELICTEGSDAALERLQKAGVRESFLDALAAWTGFSLSDPALAARHVLLSALSRAGLTGALEGLEQHMSREHGAFCHEVFERWLTEGDADALMDACEQVEGEVRLEERLSGTDAATLQELSLADVFPCVDAVLLRRLLEMVSTADRAEKAIKTANCRCGLAWHASFDCYYRGVVAIARMRLFNRTHAEGMGALPAERVWNAYATEWHVFDRLYRELHVALAEAIMGGSYDLDEALRGACDAIEPLYKNWFLSEVNTRWVTAAAPELASRGYVGGVPRQLDFYLDKVDSLARDKRRAWVVVSDALRYEVAAELAERLERETKGSCELTSVQATLPSITRCGMAALLPHGGYALERAGKDGFKVLVDGAEVPTCAARQQAIRRSHPTGIAVQYETLVNEMGRKERLELVGEADVVYVYHNVIDALGDKPGTERKVFQGCRDAVDELVTAVRTIVRDFHASDVLVTADHGFLYTEEPLGEPEHTGIDDVSGEVVEYGRRYVVAAEGATSEFLMPASLPGAQGMCGLFPRECVRIRKAGGGENYVHGGISLQEMCVPVLQFRNHRRGSASYQDVEPATIQAVMASNVVSNSLFNLDFLQTKPVGGKVVPAEYDVYVADTNHEPVSDAARIVANMASASSSERCVRARFCLRTGFSPTSGATYPLVAENTQTGEVTQLASLKIQIAFAPTNDFGW